MRILLGTHHLEVLAGSELFTAELARSLQTRGHEVAVFTFFKGEFARGMETQGIPVFDPEDTPVIARLAPDIVQTNHLPCAHFLRAVVPEAVRVHAMLGVIPHMEAPPLDGGAFSLGLAISEEVADRIRHTSFGQDVEVVVFRNWFDDSAVVSASPREPDRPLRVAVVSNHMAPPLRDALEALETEGDLKADYFGTEQHSIAIHGGLLVQYDLIVSIGRTVLLAAACGVPCIMADIHGSDGLLTIDNLDLVRTVNFSGRLTRQPITREHLREEIARLPLYDRETLRRRVADQYSLTTRVEWLLSRYDELLARRAMPVATGPASPPLAAPSEGFVHAEVTAMVRHLRDQLETARHQIAELNVRLSHAANELNAPLAQAVSRRFRATMKTSLVRFRQQIGRLLRQPTAP